MDRKIRPLWHLVVSWVLIVLMIASVGEMATVSFGAAVARQDNFDAELFDIDDTDTFDDDPYDNGGDPGGNGGDPDNNGGDPGYNGGDNGGNGGDPGYNGGDPDNNGGDPGVVRYIGFTLDQNPVEIVDIRAILNPTSFLLHGVSALDESGNNIEVTIQCHGESLLYNGHFDLERLLPGAYFTVIYSAVHLVTDAVFTTNRLFYISAEIVHTLRFYFAEGDSGVSLEDIHYIASPMQFLHEGVTVLDENNVSIDFVITDFDRIIYEYDGRYYFNLELMQPGEEFTLVYSAMHPMTGDIFSAERRFYVSSEILMHSVTFEVDEYHVIIEDIHDIENPVEFLLTGITAVDENDEELTVEIIDTEGLLIDGASIVEIDGVRTFVNVGTELPSEDGTISTDEDAYSEDSEFNLEEIENLDEFVVTFRAIHPEDPTIYETVERVFVVSTPYTIIDELWSGPITVSGGHTYILVEGAVLTGTVTINDGRLVMLGGVIQGAATAPRVTVNSGGHFYMIGGEIRGTATNTGTYGVRVNGGSFEMGGDDCPIDWLTTCPICVPSDPPRDPPFSMGSNPFIIGHNLDTNPAVMVDGGTFTMLESYSIPSIRLAQQQLNARGVRVNSGGIFNMYGGEIRNLTSHTVTTAPGHDSGNLHGIGVDLRGGIFNMHGCTVGCLPLCNHTTEIHNTATAVNLASGNPEFNMHGGVIHDNRTGSTNRSPGVNILSGTFNMHNGIIRDNFQTWAANVNDGGAGVRLMNAASSFNMHGGEIHDNTHLGGIGGGVHVRSGATFTMHNGTIRRNTTGRVDTGLGGGGVAVFNAIFDMYNGMISENRTRTSGGGVAVYGASSTFTMHNGTIHDNEATNNRVGRGIGGAGYYSGGGGVWVYRATFIMHNGEITHNRTGGYWNSWRGAPASPVSATTTFRANVPAYDSGTRTSDRWMEEARGFHAAGTGGQNQNGGGVHAVRYAVFTMHGGTISDNVAGDFLEFWPGDRSQFPRGGDWNQLPRGGTYHGGGGIATRNFATVNITGRDGVVNISNNRSPAGGGIYVDNWSQVTIGGGDGHRVNITHNIAYGRSFSNLLGWDGRGGGGIATGDGLYYGGRFHAHPIPSNPLTGTQRPPGNASGFTLFDSVLTGDHRQTSVCVLSRTVITNNVSGGDGGGIYWWASSAVPMNDERYLHGLRVEGAIVENNIALAGNTSPDITGDLLGLTYASGTYPNITPPVVPGRIDDGLNNRHNLNPRRRIATSVVRNGRVNPDGMWIHPDMAEHTLFNPYGNFRFAGPGHHAFNNHDIRTVGGVAWTRPRPEDRVVEYEPMQDIQQGRVQLEIVGPGGAPAPGSDTVFPYVDIGDIEITLSFNLIGAGPLPILLPGTGGNADQRETFRRMQSNLPQYTHYTGIARGALPAPITISETDDHRSDAVQVYNVLPHGFRWLDPAGNPSNADDPDAEFTPVNADGNVVIPRTHHGMNVRLDVSYSGTGAPQHRVTKVEVFGACGCRVVDDLWSGVVRPYGWNDGDPVPDGWAPGPYLLTHHCLTHSSGANLSTAPRADGKLPPGLRVGAGEGTLVNQNHTIPSPGDEFHFEGCLACLYEHPGVMNVANPLGNLVIIRPLRFLSLGQPYQFRPSAGFGAYGLVFRVTVEPVPEPEILRLGVIGGSIDYGTHDIVELISKDTRYIRLNDPADPAPYSTDPRDVGFAVYDSRSSLDREKGWRVQVQADGGGILYSMLRLHSASDGNGRGPFIGGEAVEILNHEDASSLKVCCSVSPCTCTTRLTRVTWEDLKDMGRDIVVDLGVNPARIPAELHRAVLTWTVIGETPGDEPGPLTGSPRITTGHGPNPTPEQRLEPTRLQEHIIFQVGDWFYGTLETQGRRPITWTWYNAVDQRVLNNLRAQLDAYPYTHQGIPVIGSTPPGLTISSGTAGGVMGGQLTGPLTETTAFVFRATATNYYGAENSDSRYFFLIVEYAPTQPSTQRRRTVKLKLKIANLN